MGFSFGRVWAIFLRYFYLFAKLDHFSDLFFWPALDIFLWGITSVWIQAQGDDVPNIALAILTGLVFWQIIWRGNYEVSVNMLQEFWNRNLVNVYATPLKLIEWITALMLAGVVKIMVTVAFGSLLVYLLYTLNIFLLGWAFLPYLVLLTVCGWFLGFISAGIIIYFGVRVQMLAWMTAYVIAPFSAIYYPLSALPDWGQTIAKCLPTPYLFEGMRQILERGTFSYEKFFIGLILSLVYLFVAILFFWRMFEKSRTKGLSRLE
jgi:ABC-2 type transport system permease protein